MIFKDDICTITKIVEEWHGGSLKFKRITYEKHGKERTALVAYGWQIYEGCQMPYSQLKNNIIKIILK